MNPKLKKVAWAMFPRGLKPFFTAFLLFSSAGYLNLQANNFLSVSWQVPIAKPKSLTSPKLVTPAVKTTTKTAISKKKKKTKNVIVKDSVEIEVDPTNSNPPLFQKQ